MNHRTIDPSNADPTTWHSCIRRLAIVAAVTAGVVVTPAAATTAAAEDPGVDCAEWDGSRFGVDVDRLNAYMVRVSFTYDDADEPMDVCPYTIFYSLHDDDEPTEAVWSAWVHADDVAAETESVVGAMKMLIPHEGCDWEVRVAVEESLPIVLDSPDLCIDDLGIRVVPIVPIEPDVPVVPARPVVTVEPVAPVQPGVTVEPVAPVQPGVTVEPVAPVQPGVPEISPIRRASVGPSTPTVR
ncbi:MAG: hypothetical protein AAFP84_00440 [Actinomycetota bacterium]